MGRSTLLIVLSAVLGGSFLTFSVLRADGETSNRRSQAQAAVLARQLAESGQAIALASVTGLGGFSNDAGVFVSDRDYDGGRIHFEDYAEEPLAGGAERVSIRVAGTYGGAVHRLASVYEFDPMDFPGPIWLDVPYASASIHTSATVSGGGAGYEPQIDPSKYDELDVSEFGLSFDDAKAQFGGAGAPVPDWQSSGGQRTGDLGDGVTTADDVYFTVANEVANNRGPDDRVIAGPIRFNGNTRVGGPDAITLVRGDAEVRGTVRGEGALVVEGDLRVPGRLEWDGLVIVRSTDPSLTVDLSGRVAIRGALLVSQEAFPPGGHIDLTTFRAPSGGWSPAWGRRAAGPGALRPSSWPLDEGYLWYDHTHRFDLPEPGAPDRTARADAEVRFVDRDRGDPQESYTGLRELLAHLGGTDVYVELENADAHGHATYEVVVDGETAAGRVARGFEGTRLEGPSRLRTEAFDARDLDRLVVRPRSRRSLKKLWDGPGACPGDEWPYCVGEDQGGRQGALTVRLRHADGRVLYEGALYWHMQAGDEEAEYQAHLDAWRAGVQSGSTPFGTAFSMGRNASVTFGLLPVVALADRLGFDGNEVVHVSTESVIEAPVEAGEARARAADGIEGSPGGPAPDAPTFPGEPAPDTSPTACEDPEAAVDICNKPGGDGIWRDRTVECRQVSSHLRHGCRLGTCASNGLPTSAGASGTGQTTTGAAGPGEAGGEPVREPTPVDPWQVYGGEPPDGTYLVCVSGTPRTVAQSDLRRALDGGATLGPCPTRGAETAVSVCHAGQVVSVAQADLDPHFAHGDNVGACPVTGTSGGRYLICHDGQDETQVHREDIAGHLAHGDVIGGCPARGTPTWTEPVRPSDGPAAGRPCTDSDGERGRWERDGRRWECHT